MVFKYPADHNYKVIINDEDELRKFFEENKKNVFVGYNNNHYDNFILKGILNGMNPYRISKFIIDEKKNGWQFPNINNIWFYTLDLMQDIPNNSIDLILCDLPYGTTACKWDSIIPFDKLWEQYNRIIKDNSAIVLFGSEPFSSKLRMSNLKNYKYDWKWDKVGGSNFVQAKKQPLRIYEDICVFYKKQPTYNPQMTERDKKNERPAKKKAVNNIINIV